MSVNDDVNHAVNARGDSDFPGDYFVSYEQRVNAMHLAIQVLRAEQSHVEPSQLMNCAHTILKFLVTGK